ncbi:lantibiotic dehydratase [Nocardia sp. R16R-3T]
MSFTPRKRRNENLVRSEQLVPHAIPIAEHRESGENLITMADLAVTADDRRFYLVQISTGRQVESRVAHALEASIQTPPLARFLADITTARASAYKAFHFGAAARLSYLPRVRYRRTILFGALATRCRCGAVALDRQWLGRIEAGKLLAELFQGSDLVFCVRVSSPNLHFIGTRRSTTYGSSVFW